MPEERPELVISLDDVTPRLSSPPPAATVEIEIAPEPAVSPSALTVDLAAPSSHTLTIDVRAGGPASVDVGPSVGAGAEPVPSMKGLVERQRGLADRLVQLNADAARGRREGEQKREAQDAARSAARTEGENQADAARARAVAAADSRAASSTAPLSQLSEELAVLRTESHTLAAANVGAAGASALVSAGEAAAPTSGFQNSATHVQAARAAVSQFASAAQSTSSGRWAKPLGWLIGIGLFGVLASLGGDAAVAGLVIGPVVGFAVNWTMRSRAKAALESTVREAFRLITAADRAVAADLVRVQEAASAERAAAQQQFTAAIARLDQQQNVQRDRDAAELAAAERDAERKQSDSASAFAAEVAGYRRHVDRVSPDWDVLLSGWTKDGRASAALLRIGEHAGSFAGQQFRWPAVIEFPRSGAIAFSASGNELQIAVRAMQSLLLQLLLRTEPGLVRYLFLDPVGSGERVAPFMRLRDVNEGHLIHTKAWSESRDMEQRLVEMSSRVSDIIHRLGDQHADIVDFNTAAAVKQELYALGVFDYPSNFGQDTSRRLSALAKSGPKCGVVPMVVVNSSLRPAGGTAPLVDIASGAPADGSQSLLDVGTRITSRSGDWQWDGMGEGLSLELNLLPPAEQFKDALSAAADAAQGTNARLMRFADYAIPERGWWQEDSRDDLSVPLGPLAASHKAMKLSLGKGGANHALIVGQTGSGKSKLLHALILGLCMRYSPVELEVYLVDFKGGVEFKPYAQHELPHARVVAIDSEPEFGLSVLDALVREQRRREELFRGAGVQNITEYEEQTHRDLSRVVLIVDEFQVMFREEGLVARRCAERVEQLVRQARSFGIHVILATQSLAGSTQLSRATMDQMVVRIALMSSETDSHLVLANDNSAARLLTRPGQAIYNDSRGIKEKNQEFQCVLIEGDEIEDIVREAAQRARDLAADPSARYQPRPRRVFEGATASDFATCPEYELALQERSATEPAGPAAWLGEPIAIGPSVRAAFKREGAHNLLIAGSDERAAAGVLRAALLGLAAQFPSAPAISRFILLDVRPEDSPLAGMFEELVATLPSARLFARAGVREGLALVAEAVSQRLESPDSAHPALFFVIPALHRVRDLRKEDQPAPFRSYDPDAPMPPEPLSQMFTRVLREGSAVGVHVLTWLDGPASLHRVVEYGGLREFGYRVALQMSANDSSGLIEVPAASALGPNRAIFFADDGREPAKFRPFGLPEDWAARFDDSADL